MAKRQPSKQQPLVGDICPMCKERFKFRETPPRGIAEAAIYIGTADEWLHEGWCHTQWYEREAEDK